MGKGGYGKGKGKVLFQIFNKPKQKMTQATPTITSNTNQFQVMARVLGQLELWQELFKHLVVFWMIVFYLVSFGFHACWYFAAFVSSSTMHAGILQP